MTEAAAIRPYIGRFAPSPTGPLHFGSLVAAVGSYLQARSQQGRWLLRMEDVDTTRCSQAHADEILHTLDHYGFEWDGEVLYQSQRGTLYDEVLARLRRLGLLYACRCSRKEMQEHIRREGLSPGIYPGTCRSAHLDEAPQTAWRLMVEAGQAGFEDPLQGPFQQCLEREVGDFVLRRADGLYAYQLAVVVDDAEQGITEVVRGSDLLDNTPRQIYLQGLLGYPTPAYVHLPVVVNAAGQKLSKQSYAPALGPDERVVELLRALRFLGQEAGDELLDAELDELWTWAIDHWDLARVPRTTQGMEIALPA